MGSVHDVPGVRRIMTSTDGLRVEFIVTVDGLWDDAIEAIEPRIRAMILGGARFEYSVVQTDWGEPDRPGFVEVWNATRPEMSARA